MQTNNIWSKEPSTLEATELISLWQMAGGANWASRLCSEVALRPSPFYPFTQSINQSINQLKQQTATSRIKSAAAITTFKAHLKTELFAAAHDTV